ncbi:MAG: DUF2059 domain-containing protein [Pseudomonadota bacterium]
MTHPTRTIKLSLIVVALGMSALLAQPALADDRAKRIEAAMEVIRTTDNKEVVETVVNALMSHIKKLMVRAHPGRDAIINQVLDDGAAELVKRRSELHAQIAEVYADEFTTAELRELLKFYRGPLGKKFLKRMPLVTQKTIVLGQKWGRDVASDVISTVQTELNK